MAHFTLRPHIHTIIKRKVTSNELARQRNLVLNWLLLLAMAYFSITRTVNLTIRKKDTEQTTTMTPVSDMNVTIEIPIQKNRHCKINEEKTPDELKHIHIKAKLGKTWRQFLNSVPSLGVYATAGGQTTLYLNKADGEPSVEDLQITLRKERFVFIKALLEWESQQDIHSLKIEKTKEGYFRFKAIINRALTDISLANRKKINCMRNDAFHHENAPKYRFSDCPEPIKTGYRHHESTQKRHQNKVRG